MFKRTLLILILVMAGVIPLSAQINAFNGFCTNGGKSAIVSGLSSSNKLEQIIPSCTVTVYLTGTTTLAPAIYKDALSTPLGNPFTADSLTAIAPGKWLFFAPDGQGYDVVLSGGIAPLTYSAPVTLTDLRNGGGGGGAGVTFFSAQNLPPLFSTTVTNPGTTPNLAFNLTNQPGNTIFGNFNGTTGPPFFAKFTCTGLLTCVYDNVSNVWNVNIPSTSTLSVTATTPILVNGGAGPVASGTANISCPTCGQIGILPLVTPPVAGQYVILRPTTVTVSDNNPRTVTTALASTVSFGGSAASAQITLDVQVPSFPPALGVANFSTFALPASIPPGNVTAVYGFSVTSSSPFQIGQASCNAFPIPLNPQMTTGSVLLTGVTGSNLSSATCQVKIDNSLGSPYGGLLTATDIGLIVYYTGTPVSPPAALNIGPEPRLSRIHQHTRSRSAIPKYGERNSSVVASRRDVWLVGENSSHPRLRLQQHRSRNLRRGRHDSRVGHIPRWIYLHLHSGSSCGRRTGNLHQPNHNLYWNELPSQSYPAQFPHPFAEWTHSGISD